MQRFFNNVTTATLCNVYTKAKVVACSLEVSGLAGDIIDITSQFEVTNDYNFNIGVGCTLVRSTSPTDTVGDAVIVRATVANCTPDMHHLVDRPSGHDVLPADGTYRYNLVIYGLSSAATSTTRLKIENGYQFISAVNLGQ